jgi:hypothetical protein
VTARQLLALAMPCARAWETTADHFRTFVAFKGSRWSTILTINK